MKSIIMCSLLAFALSGLTASACIIQIRVACPNDTTASGIAVHVEGSQEGSVLTDSLGIALFHVPSLGTYTAEVIKSTLPAGATLTPLKQSIKVLTDTTTFAEFILGGDFCSEPPPEGDCWLTGGGTIGKTKGVPNYSFGGVVYPGCSPKAAEGGNWNVVDHATYLHFQGQRIIVDDCSGVPTESPRVNVNIIDFHGEGIVAGIGGNLNATIPVTFVGRAVDHQESGGDSDLLYLKVMDGATIVMQIGISETEPAIISTGNLQIHTTSCSD